MVSIVSYEEKTGFADERCIYSLGRDDRKLEVVISGV